MSDIDDVGAPVTASEELGYSSRGSVRPVGEPDRSFAVNLSRSTNPVVRDAFAPEVHRQEVVAERRAVRTERANAVATKQAFEAERKRGLAETEADYRTRGVRFFTDAEGNIRPQTDAEGRTLFDETPWRKAGDGKGGFWRDRRNRFGRTERARPKLRASADPADSNLYYDFGEEGDEIAGHVDDMAGANDPEASALVAKVQGQRKTLLRKASLAPLARAREEAETELQRREREALSFREEVQGLQGRIAEIEQNPDYGRKAGGFLGFGSSLTEAANRLAKQREQLTAQLTAVQSREAEATLAADKDGELARRAKAAKLDHEIWESESQSADYDDLAQARRAVLKREGKAEAGDPVLSAIIAKQEEIGTTRSRSYTERERVRRLGAQAEERAAKDSAAITPDSIRAEAARFEADLKAFEDNAAKGVIDAARRDDLVTRQGTIRGQVARLNAEAVRGQRDFEIFTDGLVKDIEAYQANSERWEWDRGTVSGAFDRQADRFGKVQGAAEGKGTWVQGFGDTLGFVGGAFGTWSDVLTGVSSEGVERKRRAEEAWELIGTFKDADARRVLTARVAAEEAIRKDPTAQLVSVPSLSEKPFTAAERGRMSAGVLDLPTLQRFVNGLRESDGGAGDQIGVGTRETLRNLVSIVNVLPGVNLEKQGAPKTPEEFAKWRVLRGEMARLMAEKFGAAEVTGAVAGSLGQFMLTRKAAGMAAAKVADLAGKAAAGTRLAAVAANAERNADWLTYASVGTASSFTENPEALGFFNRFASAGMSSLGIGAGEAMGNKLESVVGKIAKVRRGFGSLAAREAAGLVGGTAGEFSSDWIESAVLNQDFTPQVPVAFWGNLGAVVGMRMFGAAARGRTQRDYSRFAQTAAAAKNEAFNRWADVKAFMASPEGKRVAELMPSELVDGGDVLARRAFASDAEGRESEVSDAFSVLSRDYGLTLGFGQFIQGVQARASRSRAALAEIDSLPDYAQADPTTGQPVVIEATRGAVRDAARAIVRVANGVPIAELTEAETQGVQLVGPEIGSEVFRDVGGAPVITDKAATWLRDRAPAAASLIGSSEAEMMARAKERGAEEISTREAADGAGSAPNIGSGAEVGGSPAPVSIGTIEFTDVVGGRRAVSIPEGATVPSTKEAVRDQKTAARWLAETSREPVRGARFTSAAISQETISTQPAPNETDRAPVSVTKGEAVESDGVLRPTELSQVFRMAVEARRAPPEKREGIARKAFVVRKRLDEATRRWRAVFPGGVRVVERAMRSGGVHYDEGTESLVVSLGDLANQLETLSDNPARVDALVTEEAIHRAAVEVEKAGGWSAKELWRGLAPATQAAIRGAYDPKGEAKPSDWQLGHELVRMLVQGRLSIEAGGGIAVDGVVVSEATAGRDWLVQIRDALSAILGYLRDLGGRLRADGNAPGSVAAVERAVALVEARVKELSGVREESPGANVPKGESPRTARGGDIALPSDISPAADDVPEPKERLGGANGGETGPRASLLVEESGRLSKESARMLADELSIVPERIGALEWVTHGGKTFWTVNVAIEADAARTSHEPDGRVNADYPQSLQPRDRSGGQYLAQQRRIAARPDIREEALRGTADHGTPIMAVVDGEAVTIMGNGRANAKALMYGDADFADAAERFQRVLPNLARAKGIVPDAVASLDQPVLARVILTPMSVAELRDLSQGSNRPAGAATNAVEQGRIDTARLSAETLALFNPEFRIDARENADFRAAFVRTVLQGGEDNTTEADLVRRIENAVFLRAYGGTAEGAASFERMTGEQSDAGIRNLVDAMLELAPEVAVARAKMAQGTLYPLDLSRDIAAAVQRIGVALRDKPRTQPVDVALDGLASQASLIRDEGVADDVLAFFVENRRDKARLLQGLRDYYALAYAAGHPGQGTLFGEEPPTVAGLWRQSVGAGVLRSAPDLIAARLEVAYSLSQLQPIDKRLEEVFEPFGLAWAPGWTEFALPHIPLVLPPSHGLLKPTKDKSNVVITPESRLAALGVMKAGIYGRAQLKAAVIEHFIEKAGAASRAGRPVALLVGGGGGAGKTSVLTKSGLGEGAVQINADEIKELIPEYDAVAKLGDGRAAAIVHEESSAIAKELRARVTAERRSLVFDATLANGPKGTALIEELREGGYEVRLIGVTVSPFEALVRAALRAKRSKRWVPYSDLIAAHRGFNANLRDYVRRVGRENVLVYDNTDIPTQIPVVEIESGSYGLIDERAQFSPESRRRSDDARGADSVLLRQSPEDLGSDRGDQGEQSGGRGEGGLLRWPRSDDTDPRDGRVGGERLLAARGQDAPDFFDALGMGAEADAFVHSLPPATRRNPAQVAVAAKKAVPALPPPALKSISKRAARIEGELDLWGVLPSAAENRLSDSMPASMDQVDDDARSTSRSGNNSPRKVGEVGSGPVVGNDLGALPLFSFEDAPDVARQEPALSTPDARAQGDGVKPEVVGTRDAGAGGTGGGVSDTLPGASGSGSAVDLLRQRGAAQRVLRVAQYLKLPPELRNYRISGDAVAPRGPRAKLRSNLDALRLLATLENENRAATPDEKGVLARFVGWGSLSQVFDDAKARAVETGDLDTLRDTVERLERQVRAAAPGAADYYTRMLGQERERLTLLENWEDQWGDAYREIKALLPAEEWERAMRSTLNAHYTSPVVIRAMWSALARMGFKGGRILEPAGGVGHFFGAMPEEMMQASELSGVELDSITGRIFAKLYPQANVQVTGFQDARIAPASQDLVISNVPFAKTGPVDPVFANAPRFNLHNYFFAKGLEKVRPGGFVAFITTHNTMDSSAPQRAWLAQRAEFVGAIRLPKTAFKENAGTEVVTDVIFLRRPDGNPPPFLADAWSEVREVGRQTVDGQETPIVINEYFQRHPEMVLGRNALSGSMYRSNEYTVEPTGDLAEQLAAAVERLPENIAEPITREIVTTDPESLYADASHRHGNFAERDGQLYYVDKLELKPLETLPDFAPITETDRRAKSARTKREKLVRRLRVWLPLRDHYKAHLALMMDPAAPDARIEESRARLNLLYDQARALDGGSYPLSSAAWGPLRHDPDFFLTLGLEVPVRGENGEPDSYRKADVFTRRTVVPPAPPTRAGNPAEALRISQAWKGRVDPLFVADLLGIAPDEAEKHLVDEGLAFRDPATGLLEDRDGYLSGYVRQKLAAAKIATDSDPSYRANVGALEAVQPPPVALRDITVRLGVSWIPPEVVTEFMGKELRLEAVANVSRTGESVRWTVGEARRGSAGSDANTRTWAGGGWTGLEIMDAVLNGRAIQSFKTVGTGKDKKRELDVVATAQAQDVAEKMRRRFTEWAKTPGREVEVRVGEFRQNRPVQEIIERGYNDHFNGYRERVWDGSHLTLPGAAPHVLGPEKAGGLRSHQKAAIWRAVTEGHAFLAHAPGFGKTNVFIAIAMEWRRLGVAKKPMIVVQNSTLEQFAASFRRMYPAANVLVASKDDLSADNRKAFTARIAASDWDAVIVAHSQFGLIPSDPETERQQIRILRDDMRAALSARMDELEADSVSAKDIERDPSVKDMAKQLEAIEARLGAVTDRRQDDIVNFGQMGIDALLIDEAHYFKKVPFATQLERIAGLDRSSSQRAFDTLVKARGIQSKRDGRGVVLGTGTPITNTLAEVWNMLRLCAPKLLENFGVQAFDDFIRTFGLVEKSVEMNAVGKFVERQRLKRFVNGAGLAQLVRAGMDVQMDPSKVTLNRPKVNVEPVVVGRSEQVGAYIERLVKTYEKWAALDGEEKQEWSAVPVVLSGLGKAASLDFQLVEPGAADDPGSKVNAMVPLVARYWREQGERKGAQLIFADSYRSVSTDYIDRFDGGGSAAIESDDGAGEESDDSEGGDGNGVVAAGERNLYHKIKDKLVAAGIPAEQIAVVTDYGTGAQREGLFAKVNAGEVRVVIGSTWKMGVGVNVQERLYAVHHLDAPWTPADLDQRNARAERDGNRYADWGVPIKRHSYAMADTLDAGRFQLLETKGKFSRQAMEGKLGVEFDDPAGGIVDEAAQMKALAAGNPLVLRQVELANRVRELEIGRQAWLRTQAEHSAALATARSDVTDASEIAARLARDFASLEKLMDANPLADAEQLAGEIDTRVKAGAKMIEEDGAFGLEGPGREVFARDVRGLRLSVTVRGVVDEYTDNGERKQRMSWRATALLHHGRAALRSAEVKTGGGKRALQLIEEARSDSRRAVEAAETRAETLRNKLAAIEREAGGEWELMDEFVRAQRGLAAVERAVRENKATLPPEEEALLSAPGQLSFFDGLEASSETAQVDRAALVRDTVDLADRIASHWKVPGIDPEDLRGDARVALVRAAKSFEPEKGNFRSFAGVAIRNALRDKYDKAKRRVRDDTSLDEEVGEGMTRAEVLGTEETMRDAVARRESAALLNSVIESLPERPRRIVRFYMDGRTLVEIGGEEGVSGEAIRKTLRNAFGVIRSRLRKEGVQGVEDGVLYSSPGGDEDAAEIRRLLDELADRAPVESMRETLAQAEMEPAGARTLGRPDLANPSESDAARVVVNAVDAARAAEAERESQDRWREEAQGLIERDRAGVLRDVLERSRRGDVLADPVMVKAAQILVADLTAEAVRTRDPQTMRDAQLLAYAYREQGSEQARAMAARHDPHKRPEERHQEFLAGALFSPTPAIRKAMRAAWSPAEKSRAVADLRRRIAAAEARVGDAPAPGRAKLEAEAARLRVELGRALQRKDALEILHGALAERLAKIESEIGKMGVTLDDVFNGEAYLRLRGAKIIGAVADKAGFNEAKRRALKLIQNGWSNSEVARRTGLTVEQVAGVEAEMVGKLKERLRTLGDAALDVGKFDLDALFSGEGQASTDSGLSAEERERRIEEIVRAMGFNRGTEREVRTRRARKPRRSVPDGGKEAGRAAPRPSPMPPADDAVLDTVRRTRARGPQAEFSDPVPRVPPPTQIPATDGRAGELENDAADALRGPGQTPVYPDSATGRINTTGGNRQLVLGEDGDVAPPVFDISDPVQVAQVARIIQATDANGFDMAFEFWVNAILSGPLTQGANLVGNAANALWDFGPKRFGEATINAALGNRADLPHISEYRHMMRAVSPALSRAWANALRAWTGEVPMFEADVLDFQLSLGIEDKTGGTRAAIGGGLGRVVRIPGRLLMATDDYFKTAIGHLEATAQAYRIAKGEGLYGERLEARIAGLVNTPGSSAWIAAVDKAKELTFQSDNDGNALGALGQSIGRLRETDFGGGIRPLRFILPFVRTPLNIFQQGIRQSPLGSASLALRIAHAGFYRMRDGKPVFSSYPAAHLAKHAVEQLIAWTVAGLLYAGAVGDDDDDAKPLLITGAVNGDTAGLRELNQRTGLRPYSVRIGGVTVSYGRIEPLATALGTTIDAITGWKRRGKTEDYSFFNQLVSGLARQTEQKTFLRGIGDLMAVVDDARDGERENYAANFIASWVPNLIRQPLRQLDPYVRDARGAGFSESLVGRIVPQTLPRRVDAYGQDMEKPGLAAWRAAIPVEIMQTPEVSRVDRLLANYARRHPQDAWAPAPVSRKANGREIDGEERRQLAIETGRLAARFLSTVSLNIENPTSADIERVKRAFTAARARTIRNVPAAPPVLLE